MLDRFIAAFKRGIEGELAAMRTSADATELTLTAGEDLGGLRYSFATTGRVQAGAVCMLNGVRVVIVGVGERIALTAASAIDVAQPCTLVVAPWFLYERLLLALGALEEAPLALALFGKRAPVVVPTEIGPHEGLNASQRAAVQRCVERDVAFVWGPPGTGKTQTLVHVVEELHARGERVLIASTTNAAIDSLLAKLRVPGIVRIGRTDAETFGASLDELVDARRAKARRLRKRIGEVEQLIRFTRALIDELQPAMSAQQSLFAAPAMLRPAQLAQLGIFCRGAQMPALVLRLARLEKARELSRALLATLPSAAEVEARVIAEARVVLCTLTAVFTSPALGGQRFDALIAEEAGMATLPPLFVAASRCDRRAIMVGDPRQLPPIVQSDDELVRRTIGRNIFEVNGADAALLDVQYRMHPDIGALVGELFYDGRLIHAARGVDEIAAGAPFPGRAVVVVDVPSTCERVGTSRVNAVSAARTAELARQATGSVAVITPYAAQAAELRKLLANTSIECSTVHRFQGRECDVVIIDLVDAAPLRPSALVGEANLLNVSISRARGKLIIVADVRYFTDGLVAQLLRRAAG